MAQSTPDIIPTKMSFIWYSRQSAQVFITSRKCCTRQQLKLDDVSLFQPLRTSQPRSVIIKLQAICCIFKSVLSWWTQGRRSVQFGSGLYSVYFSRSVSFVLHWTTRHPSEVVLNAELRVSLNALCNNWQLTVECTITWRRKKVCFTYGLKVATCNWEC